MKRGRNPKFEWEAAFGQSGLRGAPYHVGAWLGQHWNGDHSHPLAPVAMIARETHYSERSVKAALKTLREEGWIAQITRGGRRGDTAWASRYRLTVPNVQSDVPNVQSSAPQGAVGCTPVDQCVDQTVVDHAYARVGITSDCAADCPWWTGSDSCCTPTPSRFQ